MRPPSPSIPEKEFLYTSLKQSLRLDGCQLFAIREPTLSFGPELGWVECALGERSMGVNTRSWDSTFTVVRVIPQVEGKIIRPTAERPLEGMITIVSEISPMASSEYEIGCSSDEEVTITRMLDKVLRRSDAVDKESLCILAGQRVWHLKLTLHFLADAGNMVDCACLAGIIALKHFRRPEVEVIGEEITIHAPSERAPVPLAIHHTPFCFTFAFFSDIAIPPVLDPSQLEQRLSTGLLSIALNAQKEMCVFQKMGGVPLSPSDILKVMNVAVNKAQALHELVEHRLKEDWASRTVEFR